MDSGALAEFVGSIAGRDSFAVEEALGDGFVRLRTSEAERRQARHDIRCVEDICIEMLRNARDAQAKHVFLATSKSGSVRTLVFIDDGAGIPARLHEAVFEPRVTSKLETMVEDRWGVHGRGMALFSIRSRAVEARVVTSAPGCGSAFAVKVDTDSLDERQDQSGFPRVVASGYARQNGSVSPDSGDVQTTSFTKPYCLKDGTEVAFRGPRNIVRTSVEFAASECGHVEVYVGSPAEIAATLVEFGSQSLDVADTPKDMPLAYGPAFACDAAELVSSCADLGLELSERTAYRIFSGKVSARPSLMDLVASQLYEQVPTVSDDQKRTAKTGEAIHLPSSDARRLSIAPEDKERFEQALSEAFEPLARAYFLEGGVKPKVSVSKDRISVVFDVTILD